MNLGLVSGASLTVDTPNGPLPSGSPATLSAGPYTLQVTFPPQNTIGYYDIQVGQQFRDIYGVPLSPTYVGNWVILPPVISGQVTGTNDLPVPYVTIHPSGGLDPVLTDTNGEYSVQVLPNWTGTITPSKGDAMFLPGMRAYTAVAADIANQNFLEATAPVMTLSASFNGSTACLGHYAIQGVTYQILYSTNMVNWQPYSGPYVGTNGWMETTVPAGGAPAVFYKFSASY